MKKVVIILQSRSFSGLDRYTLTLLEDLKRRGYCVNLLLNENHTSANIYDDYHVTKYPTSLFGLEGFPLLRRAFVLIFLPIYFIIFKIRNHFFLKRFSRENAKFIIVSSGFPGGVFTFMFLLSLILSKQRVNLTIHNYVHYIWEFSIYKRIIKFIMKVYEKQIQLIGVSESLSASISAHLNMHCKRVYNWMPNSTIAWHTINREPRSIGFVGNIEKHKGIDLFIQLAREFQKEKFVIYTTFTNSKFSEEILRELPDNVKLNYGVTNPDEIFSDIKILILPSKYQESFGLVLIEAMSRSIPVIGTRAGGIPEVIGEDSDSGFLIPTDNYPALSHVVAKLLEDKELQIVLGSNGKKRYEHYFRDNFEELEDLLI